MGNSDGYLKHPASPASRRPAQERVGDWNEIYEPRGPVTRGEQGARCMDCGIPFCHQGCPLGNRIPDWNGLVSRDRWQDAWRALDDTNNFPEFTGRLCPAPCESACTLAISDTAVTIEQIELEIAETSWEAGWVTPARRRRATGKSVAVVGSGPAGLAGAQQLARAGHDVTVYEKADRIGGLLRYGIPDFKMEKWVIDRRLTQLTAEGVSFRTGVAVGDAISWGELQSDHDAVLLALGAERPRDLDVPGRDLGGVVFAMDYLERSNRLVAGDAVTDPIDAAGRRVVILGGGDTGSDCLGTAHRQGAASVVQIELMPAPPETRADDNPWPRWPLVFRTSSSQQEGGEREFATMTTKLTGSGGRLERLHATRVELVDGRLVPVPGGEISLEVDLLVLAMGFTGPRVASLTEQLGVELTPRGAVATDKAFATSVPGVWAAGDAKRGASLIVWAIADGREAARAMDAALTGQARLPTKGADAPFGGI